MFNHFYQQQQDDDSAHVFKTWNLDGMKKLGLALAPLAAFIPTITLVCLVGFLIGSSSNKVMAQCDLTVPTYSVDLANSTNGNVIGAYPLGGECCDPQPGNNSCLILDINLDNKFGAVAMCFDPPCSIEGYILPDNGTACPLGAGIDLCREQICIPPGETSIRVLICSKSAATFFEWPHLA